MAAFTLIQSTSFTASAVSTWPLAFGSNQTAGDNNVVVAFLKNNFSGIGSTTTCTASDTNNPKGAYSTLGSALFTAFGLSVYGFLCPKIKAGANTVTVTAGAVTDSIQFYLLEYASAVGPLQKDDFSLASKPSTSNSFQAGAPVKTSAPDGLIVGLGFDMGGPNNTSWQAPFVNENLVQTNSAVGDRIVTSKGTYSGSFFGRTGQDWGVFLFALRGPGGDPPPLQLRQGPGPGTFGPFRAFSIPSASPPTPAPTVVNRNAPFFNMA